MTCDRGEYLRTSERLEKAQGEHGEAMATLAGLGAISEGDEETLRKSVDETREAVRLLQRLSELSQAATTVDRDLSAAQRQADEAMARYEGSLEEAKRETDRLVAAQVAAESEVRSLRNLAREASSDGTCPLCGASATEEDIQRHLSERIAEADRKSAEAAAKASEARTAYGRREADETAARRKVELAKSSRDLAVSALRSARDKGVPGVSIDMETFAVSYRGHAPGELPALQASLGADTQRLEAAVRERRNAKEVRDRVAKLGAEIDLLVQKRRDCAERLAGMGIDPETVGTDTQSKCSAAAAKARTNLDAYNGILRDMAAEKARLETTEETIRKTGTFIDDLVAKKELEGKVKAKVDTLKRVRDWFGYREGPRIMSQNVMRDLTACVNSYLDQFCAPFVVEAEEEGFGFRCRFTDGRAMPDPLPDASLLSGGQKVSLAIAFRMAIYMCFGGELGLLSLDEPTAYLDDASIGHLGELLEKVGAVARNKGLQILMATHEKAIMPFLDTKIDLGTMTR